MDAMDQPQSDATPMAYDDQTGLPIDADATATAPRDDAMMPVPATEAQRSTDRSDQLAHRVTDVAQRLKPVAVVAENAAGRAVDLSARGLARLSAFLERRRQDRNQHPEDKSTDD